MKSVLRASVAGLVVFATITALAARKTIEINRSAGRPDQFEYRQAGSSATAGSIELAVGDVVEWKNLDQNSSHQAVASTAPALFDTRYIDPASSKTVTITPESYRAAGGVPGKSLLVAVASFAQDNVTPATVVVRDAPPAPRTNVIETTSVNTWSPNSLEVRDGDTIIWRNGAGTHNLFFDDWNEASKYLTPISQPGDLAFNTNSGQSKSTADANAVFLRARVTAGAEPFSVGYHCDIHGTTTTGMRGRITSGASPTPPSPPSRPLTSPYDSLTPTPFAPLAVFEDQIVMTNILDSYYVLAADMNSDGRLDLVASGLGQPAGFIAPNDAGRNGVVRWYENSGEHRTAAGGWPEHVVADLPVPVPAAAADIDGDGAMDLAVAWNYGLCIANCRVTNGIVSWLRNPGAGSGAWQMHPIGDLLATHRLYFGHYTETRQLELLALPVVGGTNGLVHAPIESTIYRAPLDVLGGSPWSSEVISSDLSVIHEAWLYAPAAGNLSRLESILVASGEGITLLRHNAQKRWESIRIGPGERNEPSGNPNYEWTGSGSVSLGKYGGDAAAYIVTADPLHGDLVTLYTKDDAGALTDVRWERTVVDKYRKLDLGIGEGPIHHVICGDFDGDGNDEFLVALRGPAPTKGVYLYKILDLKTRKLARQRIATTSAARIALGDFDGDGRLDFGTVPYNVTTYFDSGDKDVMVYYNRCPKAEGE